MDHPHKSQALAEIRTHLEETGSRDWDPLRRRMNFIGQATFWRYVNQVKAQIPPELIATSVRPCVGDRASVTGGRRFNFLGEYRDLWTDAVKLRTHALHPGGNVRNPALLDRSIRVRLKLLKHGLDLEARIFSAGAQRAFYDTLVAEIAAESPALHKRLISRLRAFSEQSDAEQSGEARPIDP